ncbi:hypothetical protein CDAR_72571 [Caerostris darwini]|uniref:Uncharacterized protein n=1 Tax=Caerostris darwini TaxID=1538125 RepID=A0AAV4MKI0_9ARAC|nr:hypothetical protein CDAR_72571 [Caerostris darwini]
MAAITPPLEGPIIHPITSAAELRACVRERLKFHSAVSGFALVESVTRSSNGERFVFFAQVVRDGLIDKRSDTCRYRRSDSQTGNRGSVL